MNGPWIGFSNDFLVSPVDNGYVVTYTGSKLVFKSADEVVAKLKEVLACIELGINIPPFAQAPPAPSEDMLAKRSAEVESMVAMAFGATAKALKVPENKLRERLFGVEDWQSPPDSERGSDDSWK